MNEIKLLKEIKDLAKECINTDQIYELIHFINNIDSQINMKCNLCGESLQLEEPCERAGLVDTKVSGGYSSTPGNGFGALDDLSTYEFSICEFCLDWLFTQFKIPPKITGPYDFEFKPAEQRVREDDWRKQKDRFYTEASRRASLRQIQLRGTHFYK
jgi:hypothetical protein